MLLKVNREQTNVRYPIINDTSSIKADIPMDITTKIIKKFFWFLSNLKSLINKPFIILLHAASGGSNNITGNTSYEIYISGRIFPVSNINLRIVCPWPSL